MTAIERISELMMAPRDVTLTEFLQLRWAHAIPIARPHANIFDAFPDPVTAWAQVTGESKADARRRKVEIIGPFAVADIDMQWAVLASGKKRREFIIIDPPETFTEYPHDPVS